jgi:transcriptional regulator with XRE-family HTH domain
MLIQKLRLQRGWSQEQLAELSGLSVRTIQRLERGQPASVESLKALGAAFEVDFSALKEPDMNATTSQSVSSDEALALAHVRKLRGFYIHLAQYGIIIGFLTIVNLMTTPLLLGGLGCAGLGCRRAVSRAARVRPGAVSQRPMGAAAGRKISRTQAVTTM